MKKSIIFILISVSMFAAELTIYNNVAFIKENSILKGNSKKITTDISRSVLIDSVKTSFEPNTKIISQKFNSNLTNFNRIAKFNIGKEVEFLNENNQVFHGVLLSTNPLVVKSNNKTFVVENNKIVFNKLPIEKFDSATLTWDGDFENINYKVDLEYLTNGLNCSANYIYDLDTDVLIGTVSINNNSGKNFEQSKISCVAGKVNTNNNQLYRVKAMDSESVMTDNVSPTNISGYFVYELPNLIDINDNENIQINFLSDVVKHSKFIHVTFNHKLQIQNGIEFKANNTIPSGLIRTYSSKNNKRIFAGSDNIDNISKGEQVILKTGESFDVKGDLKINSKNYEHDISIDLKNYSNSKKIIHLDLLGHFNNSSTKNIVCEDCIIKDNKAIFNLNPNESKLIQYIIPIQKPVRY